MGRARSVAVLLLLLFFSVAAAASEPPVAVSVTPSSGSGTAQTFSFLFSDAGGVGRITYAQALVNGSYSWYHACAVLYIQSSNGIYLVLDNGTGWQGPLTPGQAGTLQNSQCTLNAGTSSVSAVGNNLTVNAALSFKPAFSGSKIVLLDAEDVPNGLSSGFQTLGSWTVATSSPFISSISPVSGGVGTSVTIGGGNFGATPGAVSFGGLAAAILSWSVDTIMVRVPSGLSPGVVGVQVTAGGVASNSASFTVTDPLLLTPNEMTLVVDETQRLQALNADGSEVSGVTWQTDDPAVAEIIDDNGPVLSAKDVGETKLRGFAGDRSGEADVKVIVLAAGEALPAGTVKWAAPPLGSRFVGKIVQARKVDDATPDFYVQEESNGVGEVIRAFTADGQQKWRWPTDGRAIAMAAADNNGGVLAFDAFPTDTQTYLSSVSKDGVQLWRTATPKAIFSKYAVHPDGTVFYLQVPTSPVTAAQVIALNPTTGQPKFSVSLPEGTTTTTGIRDGYQNPTTGQFYTICDPTNSVTTQQVGRFGGLVIDGEGLLWVPVVANVTNKSVTCTPEFDGQGNPVAWNGSGTSYSYTSTVYLASVTSAGASSTAQLDSSSGSGTSWSDPMPRFNLRDATIPDGTGGVLVSVVRPDLSNPVYRSSGVQYNVPLNSVDQMLLGENDTLFAAGDFGGVAALNLQSGSLAWQRPDAVQLSAALDEGSVLAETDSLKRIDSQGNISDFAGGTPGYSFSYYAANLWASASATGGFQFPATGVDPDATVPNPPFSGDGLSWWWARASVGLIYTLPVRCDSVPPYRFDLLCKERPPKATDATHTNYNAIELVTTQTPQAIFDDFIRTFDVQLTNNTVARLVTPVNVSAVGDRVKFKLVPLLDGLAQDPFTVTVKRYEPASFTMSVVTMSDHPLAGWRFWRVSQTSPGVVLIEIGAVDRPMLHARVGGAWVTSSRTNRPRFGRSISRM